MLSSGSTARHVACSVPQVCGTGSNSPVSPEKLLHKKNLLFAAEKLFPPH